MRSSQSAWEKDILLSAAWEAVVGVTGLLPLGRLQSDRGSTWTSDLGPVRTWNQEMLTTRHRVPSRKSTQQPAANEHQDAAASPTGPFPLPSWTHRPALGVLLPDLTACCPLIACPSPPWHAQLCPPGCPGTTPCNYVFTLSLACWLHTCPAPSHTDAQLLPKAGLGYSGFYGL